MEPRSTTRNAAVKDALTLLRRKECAGGMEQRSNYAAAKDAQINPNLEECALSMGHRSSTTDATASTKPHSLRRSTAFGSEYEKTAATLTLPHQSIADASDSDERSIGVHEEVVICQEIVEVR
eukprot:scaffold39112_cov153-Skeletonema_marinoi.AAC.2